MPSVAEIRQQFPQYSDLSDDQLLIGLHRKFYSDMPMQQFLSNIQYTAPNPTEGMSGAEKFMAGAGKAVADLGLGVRQIGANVADYVSPRRQTLTGLVTGQQPMSRADELRAEADEGRARDAALMRTGAGMAGNLAGNLSIVAPTMLIPGVNTYTGAAGVGALSGALTPVGTHDSRLLNTAVGAGLGAAGQGVGNLAARALRPVQSTLSPEEARLAQVASREGIQLSAGQRTGSRPLQLAESVMENLPFTSADRLAFRQGQRESFNSAAMSRAGIKGESYATPDVLTARKSALGQAFEDISSRNALDFNQGLSNRLASIVTDAETHLPPDEAAKVAGTVRQIMSGVPAGAPAKTVASPVLNASGQPFTATVAGVPAGPMPGTLYQGWRQPLRDMADNTATGRYFGQIRSAMDQAFGNQLSGRDAVAWSNASREYGNLKALMQAMGGTGIEAAKGNVPPTALAQALAGQVGKEGKALGRGDYNDLVRAGRLYVADTLPDSFTGQRNFMTNILTGNVGGAAAGSGLGAAYEAATGGDPLKGALYGAGAGTIGGPAIALMAPKLAQALMQSKAGQAYLTEGLIPPVTKRLTDAHRRALANAVRSGALALPMTGASSQ